MNNEELRREEKWTGRYRGVAYSIRRWEWDRPEHNVGWAYYIYIREAQLSPEDWAKVWLDPTRAYVSDSLLSELDWHIGLTWYEKKGGLDGDRRYIEAGCDYNHSFDEGKSYCVTGIAEEAKHTIDTLHDVVTIIPDKE